jgi:hypothetical protein
MVAAVSVMAVSVSIRFISRPFLPGGSAGAFLRIQLFDAANLALECGRGEWVNRRKVGNFGAILGHSSRSAACFGRFPDACSGPASGGLT